MNREEKERQMTEVKSIGSEREGKKKGRDSRRECRERKGRERLE